MKQYVNFIGVGLHPVTYSELYETIDKWIANKSDRSHHIACINAYNLALSLKNKKLYSIYNSSDIAGADGMPFVWWIRNISRKKCDRLAAPDIILKLAEHAKIKNYTFYLYGGSPEMCIKMKEYLIRKYPHIRIVGAYSPPFRELTEEEDNKIVAEINALKPDIICVGLGTPKQDYWIDSHIYKIRGSVLIASGATFDFFGGRIKMAPEFIRRSGFEWLHRLLGKDFKRLWKRYIVMYPVFLFNFILQKFSLANYKVVKDMRE
jgi:N-acetylglucosaminyldiphosphoundecaprenol N-acetyl-beta-D-mannosaminyltransferase